MADKDHDGSKPGALRGNGVSGDGAGEPTTEAEMPEIAAGEAEPAALDEVAALKLELQATKERVLRERADLENVKKRALREKSETLRFANESLLRDLLPVIDNLQRAVDHIPATPENEALLAGVELVLRSFSDVLERHGVKPVVARGERFDPSRHEAINHMPSDEPPNTVIDEHQRGYVLHDRLLRPAMVTVSKSIEKPENDG
jgi:molecular chaperone GrpE